MKPRSGTPPILISALLVLGGCLSADPAKFQAQLREWVPVGTSAADAQQIMEGRAFQCHLITTNNMFNSMGVDYLDCEREEYRFHDWYVRFILQDGRVSDYQNVNSQ